MLLNIGHLGKNKCLSVMSSTQGRNKLWRLLVGYLPQEVQIRWAASLDFKLRANGNMAGAMSAFSLGMQ